MPRANRYFLPGHGWHITHRCHQKEFLLKFSKDRQRWRYWLLEARKRYGLCVLNYIVTSNHIYRDIADTGEAHVLREPISPYNSHYVDEKVVQSGENYVILE